MIRRPPRSTLDRSSAASDVYKRQAHALAAGQDLAPAGVRLGLGDDAHQLEIVALQHDGVVAGAHVRAVGAARRDGEAEPVSYTHLRAHETVLDLVCRLLLEKKTQS